MSITTSVRSAAPLGYVARESAVSAVINGLISAGLFWVFFHGRAMAPVWGAGGLVFDAIPQSFMVTLMGAVVPGLLARGAWKADGAGEVPPRAIVGWALQFAVVAVVFGVGLTAGLFWLLQVSDVELFVAGAAKVAYGVALSLIVTPAMLRRLWNRAASPSPRRFAI